MAEVSNFLNQFITRGDEFIQVLGKFYLWVTSDAMHALLVLLFPLLYCLKQNKDWVFTGLTKYGIAYFSSTIYYFRYRQHLVWEHRVMNLRGLKTPGGFIFMVGKVFVTLELAATRSAKKTGLLNRNSAENRSTIWEFLKNGFTKLVIIGPPGSGKTTILQHVALTFAENDHLKYGIKSYTPVFLFLRDHIKEIAEQNLTLAEIAQAHFENRKAYPNLTPPSNWFNALLTKGKAIILLDGLDEVAEEEKRKRISAWVDIQVVSYPSCPIIVTSRPQGYFGAPLQQTNLLEIQPYSWGQVEEFVNNFNLQSEILGSRIEDEGVAIRAKKQSTDLLFKLRKNKALKSLTENPLLLTMITLVHRYKGQLPGRRVELYSEIVDVFLGNWRSAVGLSEPFSVQQKKLVLQRLAYFLMKSKLREISTEDASKAIIKPLREIGYSKGTPDLFLREIESGSGLIYEKEIGKWSFSHLTFQEYLTANFWVNSKAKRDWSHLIQDSWWHETISLFVAQMDGSEVVGECIRQNNVSSLTLGGQCLEESLYLADAKRRDEFEERILSHIESEEGLFRRFALNFLFSKRFNSVGNKDSSNFRDPISCAEFQLFLDENSKSCFPPHWRKRSFPKGSALIPALGVRVHQAIDFCNWVWRKTGRVFRIPSIIEVKKFPPNEFPVWCESTGRYECYWSCEKHQRENSIEMNSIGAVVHQFNRKFEEKFFTTFFSFFFGYYYWDNLSFYSFKNRRSNVLCQNLALPLLCIRSLAFPIDRIMEICRELGARSELVNISFSVETNMALPRAVSAAVEFLKEGNGDAFGDQLLNLFSQLECFLKNRNINYHDVQRVSNEIVLLEMTQLVMVDWDSFRENLELQAKRSFFDRLKWWMEKDAPDLPLLKEAISWFFSYLKVNWARGKGVASPGEGVVLIEDGV